MPLSESAMLYAKRASILLKQKRVNAAIRDCNEALKHNPDSATAHKFRGRANRLVFLFTTDPLLSGVVLDLWTEIHNNKLIRIYLN